MTMQLIETVTVGSGGASSIEFTSIPQDGTDLVLLVSGRVPTISIAGWSIGVRFNGDTGSNYSFTRLRGTGSSVDTAAFTFDYLQINTVGGGATANTFNNSQTYIANYTSANTKSISQDAVNENNATASIQDIRAILWNNTAAITSLTVFDTTGSDPIGQHSTISLYKVTKGSDGIVTTS
jgi:hypothetical protein